MQTLKRPQRFSGRNFSADDLWMIQEIEITWPAGISRHELSHTVCEFLDWKRPTRHGRMNKYKINRRKEAEVKPIMVYPLWLRMPVAGLHKGGQLWVQR